MDIASGIGFKSVFLVTSQPYIFSHGYQIKFDEEPCPDCRIGYIVPQWVDSHRIVMPPSVPYMMPATYVLQAAQP